MSLFNGMLVTPTFFVVLMNCREDGIRPLSWAACKGLVVSLGLNSTAELRESLTVGQVGTHHTCQTRHQAGLQVSVADPPRIFCREIDGRITNGVRTRTQHLGAGAGGGCFPSDSGSYGRRTSNRSRLPSVCAPQRIQASAHATYTCKNTKHTLSRPLIPRGR